MTLASLLTPERVLPAMRATEHWPAIVEAIDRLIDVGGYPAEDREALLDSFRRREDLRSTGVGGGIAIPHAFSDAVTEVTVIFGRSQEGIDFGSPDRAPVHFLVLFIVPRSEYALHLQTLAAIAKILNNTELRAQLTDAADVTEILQVLSMKTTRGSL